MKKTLIALAIASFAGLHGSSLYAETQDLPPVTVTGSGQTGYGSEMPLTPEGGGGGGGGASSGGGDAAPPQPAPPASAPPPAPPPQTKAQCQADCTSDRAIRDAKCTGDADALRRSRTAAAQQAIYAKIGWAILKNLGIDGSAIPDAVLDGIDREVSDYKSLCGGVAADAFVACMDKCKTLVGVLPGVFGWVREA